MAGRIRSIKPELIEDKKTASLTDRQFRLFVSLLLLADDYGNSRADADQINAAVFWAHKSELPASDKTEADLMRLEELGLVQIYIVREQSYLHIRGWRKHQKVNHPGKPRIPPPPASRESPESLLPDLRSSDHQITDHQGEEEGFEEDLDGSPVREVFEHWKQVMDSPKSKLDSKRRKLIGARLKDYSVADIKKAIDGCRADPFSMGQNDRNTKFNAIDLICRDAAHIDKFMNVGKSAVRLLSDAKPIKDRDIGAMIERLGSVDPTKKVG